MHESIVQSLVDIVRFYLDISFATPDHQANAAFPFVLYNLVWFEKLPAFLGLSHVSGRENSDNTNSTDISYVVPMFGSHSECLGCSHHGYILEYVTHNGHDYL